MATYEIEIDGQTYEVDAENEQDLMAAVDQMTGGQGSQQQKPAEPEGPTVSQGEAAGYGAQQGATFGFADELQAGLGAMFPQQGDAESYGERYASLRDANREGLATAREQHGGTVMGAELLASLPASIATGGMAKATSIPKIAALGAAEGGVYGAGASEADSAAGILQDAGTGTAIGGVAGGALARGGKSLGNFLRKPTYKQAGQIADQTAENFSKAGDVGTIQDDATSVMTGRRKTGRKVFDQAKEQAEGIQVSGKRLGQFRQEANDLLNNEMGLPPHRQSQALNKKLEGLAGEGILQETGDPINMNMRQIGDLDKWLGSEISGHYKGTNPIGDAGVEKFQQLRKTLDDAVGALEGDTSGIAKKYWKDQVVQYKRPGIVKDFVTATTPEKALSRAFRPSVDATEAARLAETLSEEGIEMVKREFLDEARRVSTIGGEGGKLDAKKMGTWLRSREGFIDGFFEKEIAQTLKDLEKAAPTILEAISTGQFLPSLAMISRAGLGALGGPAGAAGLVFGGDFARQMGGNQARAYARRGASSLGVPSRTTARAIESGVLEE